MKLFHSIIFLGIISFCLNYATLSYHGSTYFYPSSGYVSMYLSSFSGYETIYLKMTVYSGAFNSKSFYYSFDSSACSNSKSNYDWSYSTDYGTYYGRESLYFKVDNNYYDYLYFKPPSFSSSYSYIYIENIYGTLDISFSVGAIAGIIIGSIIVIAAISIGVIIWRRRRRLSYIASPPVAVYSPPVQPAYPPPTYY